MVSCLRSRICVGGGGRVRKNGSFGKGFFFRKVHLLESLENLEILEISREPPDCGKQRRISQFSRESRDVRGSRVVIFFSLTEAPVKRTRTEPNGAERSQNGAETEPKWTKIQLFGVGRARGFVGVGGWGGCKGKRKSLF